MGRRKVLLNEYGGSRNSAGFGVGSCGGLGVEQAQKRIERNPIKSNQAFDYCENVPQMSLLHSYKTWIIHR